MKKLAALLVLLAALPAWAQDSGASLRGITNVRLVLVMGGTEVARAACPASMDLDTLVYNQMHDVLRNAGLRMAPGRDLLTPANATFRVHAPPLNNDAAAPIFLVSFTVTSVKIGNDAVCAFSGVGNLQARLAGARVAATGQPLPETQAYSLFLHDMGGSFPVANFTNGMRGGATRMAEALVAAWRVGNP